MSSDLRPRYRHYCDSCKLVAVDNYADWYICTSSRTTVIGRVSDRVDDYWSMDASTIRRFQNSGHHTASKLFLHACKHLDAWEKANAKV